MILRLYFVGFVGWRFEYKETPATSNIILGEKIILAVIKKCLFRRFSRNAQLIRQFCLNLLYKLQTRGKISFVFATKVRILLGQEIPDKFLWGNAIPSFMKTLYSL